MSAIITITNQVDSTVAFLENILTSDDDFWFFTGRTLPWEDEYSPPIPAMKDIYETNKMKLYLKRIQESDCMLAIRNSVWEKDVVYTQYDVDQSFFDYRSWESPVSSFYIINSEGNVYKCISNNYKTPSIQEPTGKDLGYIYTTDGYIWKFMFDIDPAIANKFPSDMWIPVPYKDEHKTISHIDTENAAIMGDIAYIQINDKGTGYTSVPDVIIQGDGIGCEATAVVFNGEVVDITITNYGSGYTYANIDIIGGGGIGCSATPMVSPRTGHGSDAKYELGAYYSLFCFFMNGNENGEYPIYNTYRNIGIIKNPRDKTGNPFNPVNTNDSFNTMSSLHISGSTGNFNQNEILMGEDSLATAITYYDPTGVDKDVLVYNIEESFIDGEIIHSQDTSFNGVYTEALSDINTIDFNSGDILYSENIIFITRREIQTERFIFTIEF